jgi:hypothetical protein
LAQVLLLLFFFFLLLLSFFSVFPLLLSFFCSSTSFPPSPSSPSPPSPSPPFLLLRLPPLLSFFRSSTSLLLLLLPYDALPFHLFSPLISPRYPLSHCGGKSVTMEELLDNAATLGQATKMEPHVKNAESAGILFVIGEGNSVSCGGFPGVSDRFGAALWGLDFMFAMAKINAGRINFHGGGEASYSAIAYKSATENIPDVRALYYAMLGFSRATANHTNLVETSVKSSNSHINVWAGRNEGGEVTCVVIHKDMHANQDAHVTISLTGGSGKPGKLGFLEAPSVTSEYGIKIFGQTFDGSKNGEPIGKETFETVTPSNGKYEFVLKKTSVAFLTLPK